MANYNKSFNFRNGVQVDTDKFIVNTAGLVGIGSTLPTNYLDVNGGASVTGDIQATGLVTSSQLYVSGISTILGSVGIGTTNIDAAAYSDNSTILNAGIVTAVKYYGDGTSLSGVRSIAVDGWVIDNSIILNGAGIAYTTFSVGIGTTPGAALDVVGDIRSRPKPWLYTNNEYATTLTAREDATHTLELTVNQNSNTPSEVLGTYADAAGVNPRIAIGGTSGWNVGIGSLIPTQLLDVSGTTETKILRVTGTSLLVGNVELTNGLTVNGSSTLNSNVTFAGAASTNMTWDKSSNFLKFDDHALAVFGTDSSDRLTITHDGSGGNAAIKNNSGWMNFFAGGDNKGFSVLNGDATKNLIQAQNNSAVKLYWAGDTGTGEKITTSGVGVTVYNQIDAGTVYLDQGYLESINSTGISTVSVGQSVGVGKSTGILRFGSATGTLDLINNDDGDLTFGLHGSAISGINTGDFKWNYRTNNTLMTLSYGGNLGINEETPIHPLHVGGSSTITGAAWFGNDVNVKNNINCDGTITGTFTLQDPITSRVNSTGVSTVGSLYVYGGTLNNLGIGTNKSTGDIKLDVTGQALFRGNSGVGINTIAPDPQFPLVVSGDMKVNKITGFTAQGVSTSTASVTLQHNGIDRLTTTGTGVTVNGTVGIGSFVIVDGGTPASDKLMVSSGIITVTRSYHTVDTLTTGYTDITTIEVGSGTTTLGQIVILRPYDSARDVKFVQTGNIRVQGDYCSLDNNYDHVSLIYNGQYWCELSQTRQTT